MFEGLSIGPKVHSTPDPASPRGLTSSPHVGYIRTLQKSRFWKVTTGSLIIAYTILVLCYKYSIMGPPTLF